MQIALFGDTLNKGNMIFYPFQPEYLRNYRLPRDLKPNEYGVELRPVFEMVDDSYWFYGVSSVNFTCVNPTDKIVLHSK